MWHLLLTTSGDPALDWLSRAGALGIMAAVVIGFLRGTIVSGREHQRVISERDRALELVYRQAGLAHRTVDVTAQRLELEEQILARAEHLLGKRDG